MLAFKLIPLCRVVLAALVSVGCLGVCSAALAELPADDTFDVRRVETLQNIAGDYVSKNSYTNCVQLGFATVRLAAKIELQRMGESGGISAGDAAADIAVLADEAYRFAGTTQSECAWENRGWPGVMHAAVGLGYILHEWKDELPQGVQDKIARALQGHWKERVEPHLANFNINVVAGLLLGGEALGYDSEVWKRGIAAFDAIYERTTHQGGLEVNAPLYSAYHFPGLMLLLALEDDSAKAKARILLEYELIFKAHLYMPGGGLGAPQARDRHYGGALDHQSSGMHRVIAYLTGDTTYDATETTVHLVAAVSDYRLPEAIRSIFLDKADGYSFSAYHDGPWGRHRFKNNYDFGTAMGSIAPWQAVMLPGGDAMFGVDYGFHNSAIHVSMGVYARAPDGSFPILYQYQPYVQGDTREDGNSGLPGTNGDQQPDDFVRELYDYQRMVYGRTMISIWDPTEQNKDEGVVRTEQNTRVHFPDYAAHGGQVRIDESSGWMIGNVGDVYVAYHPLGTAAVGPQKRTRLPEAKSFDSYRDSPHYFMKLDGRSGGVFELATTGQFATIDDYLADLKTRHLSFSTSNPMTAEFDALDPDTGQKVRIVLEYADSPDERRVIDGQEFTPEQALDRGLLHSPWVSVDRQTRLMRLERGCYDRIVYDLANATITEEAPTYPDCLGRPESGPVFSAVPHFGDTRNWEPKSAQKWSVVEHDGDARLFLEPEDLAHDEQRLGEYNLVKDRSFTDFTMTLRAKTFENLERNPAADYAVIFGWQDSQNYYFLLPNANPDFSELLVVEDGQRRQLALASQSLIPDADWHTLEVARHGSTITVQLDGEQVLQAQDDTFGEGRVGVGSFNDSALFDDIDVQQPSTSAEDVGAADAFGSDAAGGSHVDSTDGGARRGDVRAEGSCACGVLDAPAAPIKWAMVWLVGCGLLWRRKRN